MNLIIDRLGDSVKPFAEGLLRLLPSVWQDAEGQSLLRIQVTAATPPCLHPCLNPPKPPIWRPFFALLPHPILAVPSTPSQRSLHPCGPYSPALHLPPPLPLGCPSHKFMFVVSFPCSMQALQCKQPLHTVTKRCTSSVVLLDCLQTSSGTFNPSCSLQTPTQETPDLFLVYPCAHVPPCSQSSRRSKGGAWACCPAGAPSAAAPGKRPRAGLPWLL